VGSPTGTVVGTVGRTTATVASTTTGSAIASVSQVTTSPVGTISPPPAIAEGGTVARRDPASPTQPIGVSIAPSTGMHWDSDGSVRGASVWSNRARVGGVAAVSGVTPAFDWGSTYTFRWAAAARIRSVAQGVAAGTAPKRAPAPLPPGSWTSAATPGGGGGISVLLFATLLLAFALAARHVTRRLSPNPGLARLQLVSPLEHPG
jgi:hypothetical protein